MRSFYEQLSDRSKKRFAILIDPDKYDDPSLEILMGHINQEPPDLLLVGGSILFNPIDLTITTLKLGTHLPVFLFPGKIKTGRWVPSFRAVTVMSMGLNRMLPPTSKRSGGYWLI